MNHTFFMRLALMLAVTLTLPGCDGGSSSSPAPATSLEGAWLGEGAFSTQAGDMDVRAQLELLDDGSYRLLILEPGILAMAGPEQGQWSRTGDTLTLTPAPGSGSGSDKKTSDDRNAGATSGGGVFAQLRQGSGPKPAKVLAIDPNLRDLRFDDGKLSLTFLPNPEATKKLRDAGVVGK